MAVLRHIPVILALALIPAQAIAQYALPSTETAISIGNFALATEMGVRAARGTPGRGGRSQPPALVPGTSVFSSALAGPATPAAALPDTRFERSLALQRKSEAAILALLSTRQPEAVAEYQHIFARTDMSSTFEAASQAFGFRSNDVADTMAAYWLVSWVVANDAKEFSPAAARAVRDQVKAGIARTDVAGFSLQKKHQLADEAIFNTLLLTALFHNKESGKVSLAGYRRVGDVTRRAFLAFGADLRALKLTDAGFQKR